MAGLLLLVTNRAHEEISQVKLQVRLAVNRSKKKSGSTFQKDPCDFKGHKHTSPEGRREILRSRRLRTCVRRQTSEDMTRGQDGTKVCVVAMKGNQAHRDNR